MSAIPNFPPGFEKAINAGVDAFGNMVYTQGKAHLSRWASGKVDQGLEAITNRADTFFNQMSRPVFDSRGYSPPAEFQHWAQQNNNSQATKKAKAANGQSSSTALSDGVTCPAMFNPGRGAELGLVNKLIDTPLAFKTGEPAGPLRPQDPLSSVKQLYRGVRLAQAFAFKGVVPVQATSEANLSNRGYVHNVFRHYNYATFGTGTGTYQLYGTDKAAWNNTLGPDSALVRTAPRVTGTQATDLTNAGLNATLTSPYRSPGNGAIMYSRLTQQFVENVGWACHPYKYVQASMQGTTGTGSTLSTAAPVVYNNSGKEHWRYPKSLPAQQPTYPDGTASSPYYYRSQQGKGKVSYDFSNDGTCPVVIDVVINKVKQGTTWNPQGQGSVLGAPLLLDNAYKNGYGRIVTANQGFVDANGLSGQAISNADCLTNSRTQFMPKAALKYANNASTSQASTELHDMPFKQIARDQFIISAGASRSWRFELPALDYDPRRYGNRTTDTDGNATTCLVEDIVCDFTYIVSIAYSAVSTPVLEVPTGTTAKTAIIDRRSGDCNVSVTGQYEEYVYPVYLGKETLTTAYINSALDVPVYTTAPAAGIVSHNEIANLNQVTRGSTPGSALISVGAINSLPGA